MRLALAGVSLLLGTVYMSYGILTAIDLKRGWRTQGFSHFGAAWIAMAFTCGPHHLHQGVHLLYQPSPAGGAELLAVVVGVPMGATWFLLRVEAMVGGRGDRFVSGTPGWLRGFTPLAAVYVTAFLIWGIQAGTVAAHSLRPTLVPNVLLIVLYVMIGWQMLKAQLRNRGAIGGWSVSGVSLTCVFFTCAVMHLAWLVYAARGVYGVGVHSLLIDWLSVPAALYFLWVTRSLQVGLAVDWNQRSPTIAVPERAA